MTTSFVDNGVNVEALLGARAAFADAPEIARFQWRSSVSWVNGTHSRSDVQTFFGFGEEQTHSRTFAFDIDHPLQFAAQDNGITPIEYVLVALGGCLTAGIAAVAQQRGIQLRSVQRHGRRGDGPAGHPRRGPRRAQRLQRRARRLPRSTPTRRPRRSRRWSRSRRSGRRSTTS